MKINISNLSEGVHKFALTAEPGEVGLGEQFHNQVHVALTLEKSNGQMHIRAQVETTGSFRCDRCVENFDKKLKNEYQMLYTSEPGDPGLYNPDEVQVVSREAHEIDIDEDVRQFIMLAVPQKLLCKESCLGLCPRCGRNLNREQCVCTAKEADPRWDKLRGLLNAQ
jgi:uncharacterized protein